ncbi:MAG: hypothetical protein AAF845_02050 [Bacteroidota bacterium]
MRRALLLPVLVLLVAPGCDTDPVVFPNPDPDPVPVTVTYRVTATGSVEDAAVRYTNADGDMASEGVDFGRTSVYNRDVLLDAGATGTFSVTASGTVDSGRLNIRILATETGNVLNEVASASAVETSTVPNEQLSVTAEVTVPVAFPRETTE